MTLRTYVPAIAIAVTAAIAACNSGGTEAGVAPNGPSASEIQASEDVADVSANELGSDLADDQQAELDLGFGRFLGFGGGPNLALGRGRSHWFFPPGLGTGHWSWGPQAQVNGACPLDSIGFTFTFPASNPVDTIAYARTWQFFSVAGCERDFVSDSTDSVASTYAFIGDFNGASEPWSGHHQGSSADALTATQEPGTDSLLATASTHVWNGSADAVDSVFFNGSGQQRHHEWLAYDTTTNVTFPNPRRGDWFPLSGTWTRWLTDSLEVTGDTTFSKTYGLHLVLTFAAVSAGEGNPDATLQIYNASTGALLKTCSVDLRRGRIVPGSCH
jgi:hypothetical protein